MMNESCDKVFIDGHAHLHDPADMEELYNHAAENFMQQQGFDARRHQAVLLLAQIGTEDFFAPQRDPAGPGPGPGAWRHEATTEMNSFHVIRDDGFVLFVVAGRQIVSREGVEVLVFGGDEACASQSLGKIIDAVVARQDALAILPWGAGKWLGKRGRLITELLGGIDPGQAVFLGDNGGRPALWSRVPQFELAGARGVKMLNGSDPLPLSGDIERAGSFGTLLRGGLDNERPCSSLIAQLKEPGVVLEPFGAPLSLAGFVKKQLMLRCRGR